MILMKLDFSRQIFVKKNLRCENSIKIHSVGAEFLHVDGQTDITKLIGAIRNCANAPNN